MKNISLLLLVLFICCSPFESMGQTPVQVKDIKSQILTPAPNSYNDNRHIAIGDKVYFFIEDPDYGIELFVSDGTTANTRLVKDLFPGPKSSPSFSIRFFIAFQNQLFFVASDGATGYELWKSDGTDIGTQRISDLRSDFASQGSIDDPSILTVAGDYLYFVIDQGYSLYRTDGSAGGTTLVKDFTLEPPFLGQQVRRIIPGPGNTVYVQTENRDFTNKNYHLWKSDGTLSGTIYLDEIPVVNPATDSFHNSSTTTVGNDIYFLYRLFTSGSSGNLVGNFLYKSSSTPGTMTLVKEWLPPLDFSFGKSRAVANRLVFFDRASSDLWSSDGTTSGTQAIANIPGMVRIYQPDLGRLVLTAQEANTLLHVWASDGTSGNTQDLLQIPLVNTNNNSMYNIQVGRLNGSVYFAVGQWFSNQFELWKSDGTLAGTQNTGLSFSNVGPGSFSSQTTDGTFYFHSQSQPIGANQLWKTDLTQNGTQPLAPEIYGYDNSASPKNFLEYNGAFYFSAEDDNGIGQWQTDGTAAGTQKSAGVSPAIENNAGAATWQGQIYYASGNDIYKTDGNTSSLVFQSSQIGEVISHSGNLIFSTEMQGSFPYFNTGHLQLALSDGSFSEIAINSNGWAISNVSQLYVLGNDLYFQTDEELYQSGPTQGCCFTYRKGIYRYDGNTVFPLEYWLRGWPGSGPPLGIEFQGGLGEGMAILNNELYFTSHTQLFKTGNGSDQITTILDLPIVNSYNFDYLSAANGLIYFSANDGTHGYEIWRSDGSTSGTFMLKDLRPGNPDACPKYVVPANNGKSYFLTDNCRRDYKIWETDGTSAGTKVFVDLANFFSINNSLIIKDDVLYFTGNDGQSGEELWKINLPTNSEVDLELSISSTAPSANIYQNVTFTLTISNSGTQNAGNIIVDLPVPAGLAFVSQNVPIGSYSNWNGQWTLPGLNAGQSASLELTLFTLTTDAIAIYAQVSSASDTDADSTPGNGTPPTPNEDDETLVYLNQVVSCSITYDLQILCNDNGTANPNDDFVEITIDPGGTNLSASYSLNGTGVLENNIPYGNPFFVGNFPISGGNFNFKIIDDFTVCFATVFIDMPQPCSTISTCALVSANPAINCDDAGTPNISSDDNFEFFTKIEAANSSGIRYNLTLSSGTETLFFTNMLYGENFLWVRPITEGPISVLITDVNDSFCSLSYTITPPPPCSNGFLGVDLEISNLSSSNIAPDIYSNVTFNLQVHNNGTTAATGVAIDFPIPAGMAFVSQVVGQGNYQNWLGNWDIGTINPGASVDLELTLFTLTDNTVRLFAEVASQNETDLDSSPGNGNPPNPHEDDEAVISINSNLNNMADLSISATANPMIIDNGIINYFLSIRNDGPATATNVQVLLSGVSVADFHPNIPSSGSVSSINFRRVWTIPSIAPGTTETLATSEAVADFAFSNPKNTFFEVIAVDQNDPDSSPDNDQNDRNPDEDDEAAILISPTGTDVPYDLELTMTSDRSTASQGDLINYTLIIENKDYPVSGTIVDIQLIPGLDYISHSTNSGIYDPLSGEWALGLMEHSSNGNFQKILEIVTQVNFSDVGPFTLYAEVTASNGLFDYDSDHGNGICCIPIEDDEAAVTIIGNDGGGDGPDLELSLSASETTFDAWQLMSMTLTVENTGTEEATNVVIDFPEPAGAIFQGGNEYTASQGTYIPYQVQQWSLGNLPAGEIASITFNLFTTQATAPLIGYGQVWSMGENDSDSTPGNGNCCTAMEDDEAVITLVPVGNDPTLRNGLTLSKPSLESIYPNPAQEIIHAVFQSPEVIATHLSIYNSMGKLVKVIKTDLDQSINIIAISIADLPSGVYTLHFPEGKNKRRQLRFIKHSF